MHCACRGHRLASQTASEPPQTPGSCPRPGRSRPILPQWVNRPRGALGPRLWITACHSSQHGRIAGKGRPRSRPGSVARSMLSIVRQR
jgi:hypothetical protein